MILGLHSLGHDTGACLFDENGKIIFSIETERLTRQRHDPRCDLSIQHVLDETGVTPEDITSIAVSTNVGNRILKIDKLELLASTLSLEKMHLQTESHALGRRVNCTIVAHEVAHATIALNFANWIDPCLVLVNEGKGTFSRNSLFLYQSATLQFLESDVLPWYATGFAWSALGYAMGMGVSPSVAGKLMAIGAYGKVSESIRSIFLTFSKEVHRSDRQAQLLLMDEFLRKTKAKENFRHLADTVATLQALFTESVTRYIVGWSDKLQVQNIALSGGCALNINTNTAIRQFKSSVFIPPACNDSGLALGSALYRLKFIEGISPLPFDAWVNGKSWDSKSVESAAKKYKLKVTEFHADQIARSLETGMIIGFFSGKSAIGPRSLGERSILANPAISNMRTVVSQQVKNREWYRPLSPIMTHDIFTKLYPGLEGSKYMLFNYQVKVNDGFFEAIHHDHTARIQTIQTENNPRLHELLTAFHSVSGCPALINTSLNTKGRSIAYSPNDAIVDLVGTGVSAIAFDQLIVHLL